MKRRNFIQTSSVIMSGITVFPTSAYSLFKKNDKYISGRPPVSQRKFKSFAVEEKIKEVKASIKNKELAWMFENCYPNTLDTTVNYKIINGIPDTFVITGDINAMWLRDSTAQVWPYISLINEDDKLKLLIKGVINRQTKCILIDPYANAFNYGKDGSHWESDNTEMKPELHERKWEIDSLCYPVRLAYNYWKLTGESDIFDSQWLLAAKLILKTFKEQQRKESDGPYHFTRCTTKPTDTLSGNGYGNPVNPIGLICSSFRPSDDATFLSFLIPSNYFAINTLKQISVIANVIYKDIDLANETISLSKEIEDAIKKHAIQDHLIYGNILAYEIDGFGNKLFMDDANIPSLLSLPYLGVLNKDNELYQNTRNFILSKNNPWFFEGKFARGIGGPHVGKDMVWPMSIIMQALTSNNEQEIIYCINSLINTHAGTGFVHESFNVDNPNKYTRSWFAWANTLFGELIVNIHKNYPEILKKIH